MSFYMSWPVDLLFPRRLTRSSDPSSESDPGSGKRQPEDSCNHPQLCAAFKKASFLNIPQSGSLQGQLNSAH